MMYIVLNPYLPADVGKNRASQKKVEFITINCHQQLSSHNLTTGPIATIFKTQPPDTLTNIPKQCHCL